VQDFIS